MKHIIKIKTSKKAQTWKKRKKYQKVQNLIKKQKSNFKNSLEKLPNFVAFL
jgi:hypothetical protein